MLGTARVRIGDTPIALRSSGLLANGSLDGARCAARLGNGSPRW